MTRICAACKYSNGKARSFMTCGHPSAKRVCLVTGEERPGLLCELMRARRDQLADPPEILCGPEGDLYEAKQ